MQVKKNPHVDLERRRSTFLQIGFVAALGAILIAFEWTTPNPEKASGFISEGPIEEEIMMPIIKERKEVEVPKKIIPVIMDIVSDLEEISEDDDIDWSTDVDENDAIDLGPLVEDEPDDEVYAFYALQDKPEFPGGEKGLMRYIVGHVKYPVICQELGIQGTVYVSFVISSTGKVTNVTLLRGCDENLDRAAIQVVSEMPDWKPGVQGNKPVNVSFQLPVKFVLN